MTVTSPTAQRTGPRAVILLRVGDRNVKARQRFRETGRKLQARLGPVPVLAAYIVPGTVANELTLTKAVAQVVAEGYTDVIVLPCEIEWDSGEWQDVPETIQEFARANPTVTFRLAQPIATADGALVEPLLDRYAAAQSAIDLATATVDQMVDIAAQPPIAVARVKPGEVPQLPPHDTHVFVCLGRVCQQENSAHLYNRLTALLDERGLTPAPGMHGLLGRASKNEELPASEPTRAIKVTRTKCLGPCAGAPVSCVYPEGTFYWGITEEQLPHFVDEVLVNGRSLPERIIQHV